MKLTLSENIRSLRRERNITQEEFASYMGVSCQSVSRWETGLCYPDMELVPEIAAYFGVTVDWLLGADKRAEARAVEGYLTRFQDAVSRGLVEECISIAREGVKEYPNNYTLLNKLMYALFISGDSESNDPAWQEKPALHDAEIISLGERIMKYCPEQDIRLEATARLAFHHCEMGRREQGRVIYETLPPAEYCRENCMWPSLLPNEREDYLRSRIHMGYEGIRNSAWLLTVSGCVSDRDAIPLLSKLMELEQLMDDGENGFMHVRLCFDLGRFYAKIGEWASALDSLACAADAARAFDARPESRTYTSCLLGQVTVKHSDVETDDPRPLSQTMRDMWLAASEFDPIRSMPGFRIIMDKLEAKFQ